MSKISCLFPLVLALAVSLTFFGKSLIGILLGVAVLLSVVWIGYKRKDVFQKDKVKAFFAGKECLALLVMIVTWGVSSFMAINQSLAVENWIEISGMIVGGGLIYTALNHMSFLTERFFRVSIVIATLCATMMVATPWIRDVFPVIEWRSSYGSVLAILMPFAMVLAYTTQGRGAFFWWFAVFMMSSGIFASGGRTAWVVLVVVAVASVFMMPLKDVAHRGIKTLVMFSLMAMAVGVGLFSYKHNVGDYIYEARTQAMTNMERPASGRLTVWKNAIPHIRDHWVFGVGIKGSKALNVEKEEGHYVAHMHNAVLEILLETGMLGLFAISLVIVVFVTGFLKAYRGSTDIDKKRASMAVFLACVAYGVASLSLTSMFHAYWFLYMVALLVLLKTSEYRLRAQ